MPPEQIRNKGSSQESDIYALGGLFYQIASGHPPFTGYLFTIELF
jgi:serine/threonine protein kinase